MRCNMSLTRFPKYFMTSQIVCNVQSALIFGLGQPNGMVVYAAACMKLVKTTGDDDEKCDRRIICRKVLWRSRLSSRPQEFQNGSASPF
jgi:hypothetical protein